MTMITVLFVGAALTALTSTAMFVTIQEFRAGTDDKKAAEALAYAEAGIDRMIHELRTNVNFGQMRTAGCEGSDPITVSGKIGGETSKRTFEAILQVWNGDAANPADRLAPAACGVPPHNNSDPRAEEPRLLAITSVGEHPTARRVVRQIIEVKPIGLPIGIYADRIDANGNGGMVSISMISPTDIVGRAKMAFAGDDPYYVKDDFYDNDDMTPIPAAAHAGGQIYPGSGGGAKEHPPSPNCEANLTTGTNPGTPGQSLWDGSNWTNDEGLAAVSSGCAGQTGFPPTSRFDADDLTRVSPRPELSEQDYLALKEAAKASGLYCLNAANCTREGAPITLGPNIFQSDLGNLTTETNWIAYFEYDSGDPFDNVVRWKASVQPCSDDPNQHRSVVLVVRNGSMEMQSESSITGFVLVPEGYFDSAGAYITEATVIAKEFRLRGQADLRLSECWVRNFPAPFVDVVPRAWSEVDR
ncbi:MAG: hypothetical protein GEU78_15750 [Actinobacteria bacterium]|nr:hypothetical protein [Actinomycetota bacterium]